MTGEAESLPAAGGLTSYYEQFLASGFCTRSKAPRVLGWQEAQKQAVIFRPPCNMWSCPECSPTLRAKASIRAYLGALWALETDRPLNFLTLTSHEKLNPWRAWEVFPGAWNKLNQRARRVEPDGQFFAVREFQRNGRVHLHAITTWGMEERWWKDSGRACGLGYIADLEAVRSPPGAGAYALKYLLKQVTQPFNKGTRRYNASRGWPPLPELQKADGWQFDPIPRNLTTEYVMREWQEQGFDIRLLSRGEKLKDLETIFGEISVEAENEHRQQSSDRA